MAIATQYKPMRSKVVKDKMPVEIIRCVDNEGNYILLKKYEAHHYRKLIPYKFEQEPCKLDMPAKFKLTYGTASYAEPNKDYTVQMIKYCINKQNINEYELRNLVMSYLKGVRKQMDKDKFKSVCSIFDKADKMLNRADKRKNSNINEANTSYRFLVKSYERIVDLCEVEKKVESDIVELDIIKSTDDMIIQWQKFNNMVMKGAYST